jgi:uncharacterized protein (DUF983 family)
MTLCPICNQDYNEDTICDNDCGTIYCNHCDHDYYFKIINSKDSPATIVILKQGHNPKCGDDSEIESDD